MTKRQDYRRMLEDGFAACRDVNPHGTPESRSAYLADYIFDFTTYDDEKSEEFGIKALEVCRAISNRKTFEYIADPVNYRWYLLMVNMPFFSRRLNWGASVRDAWWDTSTPNETELDTTALWLDGEMLTEPMKFSTQQWLKFVAAMLDFANEEPTGLQVQSNNAQPGKADPSAILDSQVPGACGETLPAPPAGPLPTHGEAYQESLIAALDRARGWTTPNGGDIETDCEPAPREVVEHRLPVEMMGLVGAAKGRPDQPSPGVDPAPMSGSKP